MINSFTIERTKLVAEGYVPRFAPPGEPTPWVKPDHSGYTNAIVLIDVNGVAQRIGYYEFYARRAGARPRLPSHQVILEDPEDLL